MYYLHYRMNLSFFNINIIVRTKLNYFSRWNNYLTGKYVIIHHMGQKNEGFENLHCLLFITAVAENASFF